MMRQPKKGEYVQSRLTAPERAIAEFFAAAAGDAGNISAGIRFALDTLYQATVNSWSPALLAELLAYLRRMAALEADRAALLAQRPAVLVAPCPPVPVPPVTPCQGV